MDHRAYWVWLQHAFGAGSRRPWEISKWFEGGVREFYKGGARLWNSLSYITEGQAVALFDFTLAQARAQLEHAEKIGWTVLTPECEKYPEPLRHISDPPAVLYVKGSLPDLDRYPAIAIAGARKATAESIDAARKIGYQLACGSVTVVGGGAAGIDAAALDGAIQSYGRVVSILPVDLSSSYVSQNARLRREILEKGGALLSEYFSQSRPGYSTFQERNRLITGMSRGVVLIQAAEKSGTMIYARHALEQNRDVFVYPGPEDSPEYSGSRALLLDGAKAVTCGEEVLEEYDRRYAMETSGLFSRPDTDFEGGLDRETERERELVFCDPGDGEELGPEAEKVLTALGGETLTISQLEERTGMGAGALLSLLTELELEGRVESASGKRYRRV